MTRNFEPGVLGESHSPLRGNSITIGSFISDISFLLSLDCVNAIISKKTITNGIGKKVM